MRKSFDYGKIAKEVSEINSNIDLKNKQHAELKERNKQICDVLNEVSVMNLDDDVLKLTENSLNEIIKVNEQTMMELSGELSVEHNKLDSLLNQVSHSLEDAVCEKASIEQNKAFVDTDSLSQAIAILNDNIAEMTDLCGDISDKIHLLENSESMFDSDNIHPAVEVKDKDSEYTIDELLSERQLKADALKDVLEGTIDLISNYVEVQNQSVPYAEAAAGAIGKAAMVATVSTALAGARVKELLKRGK